jgi:hypothetical protein
MKLPDREFKRVETVMINQSDLKAFFVKNGSSPSGSVGARNYVEVD